MPPSPTKIPSTLKPLAEELFENDYARKKPKRTGRNVVLGLIGAGVVATGVVLGTNEDLRNQVFGSAKALGDEIIGSDEEAPKPQ